MSIPVYILDDDTVVISDKDIPHVEFWEQTVCKILSQQLEVSERRLKNLPYCQRRGRAVGSNFYCGEYLSPKVVSCLKSQIDEDLRVVYDEHETRLFYDIALLRGLKNVM